MSGRMFSRALLLLLLVLNAGVAAWWLLRPDAPPALVESPPTAPRLELVGEGAPSTRHSSPRMPIAPVAPGTTAPPHATTAAAAADAGHCLRLGPFDSDAALAGAQSALQAQVSRLVVSTVSASGRGWRVWLPPLADRDAAQAMATRIGAAGFSDYYVVPDGAEANSLALGRYGNAESAQRREAQLQAAGFPAQAQALGVVTRWIDVATTRDAATLRAAAGAAQARPLDCARLH